ncbi:MAG: carboxypeptidase regulatory-like domain-containing protein [Planctomycetes bacterium]|nr:carboxypeptidase regulatory-like domain-containing protein [Planctomycetota bacterium]
MRDRRTARRGGLLVLTGGCLLAAAVWWAGGRAAPPVPAVGGPDPPAAGTAGSAAPVAPDTGATTAADAAGERTVVLGGRVHGVLRDAAGVPLAGWPVDARRGERDYVPAPSLAGGRFRFDSLEPGTWRIHASRADGVDVEVAAGTDCSVDLRLPADRCAFSVALTENGQTPHRLRLRAELADGDHDYLYDHGSGRVGALLPFGEHVLRAESTDGTTNPSRPMVLGEWPLVLGPGTPVVQWTLDVAHPVVTASFDDGTGLPVDDLVLRAEGTPHFGGERVTFASAPVAGRATSLGLPPGCWDLTLQSPYLQVVVPQRVDIPPGQQRVELAFACERAAVLALDLRRVDGRPFVPHVPAAWLPDCLAAWWNGVRVLPGAAHGGRQVPGAPSGLALVSVPTGRGTVAWRDHDGAEDRPFLPFDPVGPCDVDVAGGGRDVLRVVVEPRARVTLVACERGGREQSSAVLRVFVQGRVVRSLPVPRTTRWEGFLPPGDHTARIAVAGGAEVEHPFTVQRRDLTLRLRQ